MSELNQGTKLSFVCSQIGEEQIYYDIANGWDITVVMEAGQMSGVPWAKCTKEGQHPQMVNLALCESVGLVATSGEGQGDA